jgi:hypothetical protein
VIDAHFTGKVWFWRGPSPFHFVSTPEELTEEISNISSHFSYGWGAIPATVTIGETEFSTSIFPKDGTYLVPLKKAVRDAEGIDVDDEIDVYLIIGITPPALKN